MNESSDLVSESMRTDTEEKIYNLNSNAYSFSKLRICSSSALPLWGYI